MPKYLFELSYKEPGLARLFKEGGSKRLEGARTVVNKVGGSLEALYFAFGDTDLIAIVDLPDNVTAAAMSLAFSAGGGVTSKVTPLLTPEEIDQAVKVNVGYQAPD